MPFTTKPDLSALLHEHFSDEAKNQDKEFACGGELLNLPTAVSTMGVLPGLLSAAQLQFDIHGLPVDLGFKLIPDEAAIFGYRIELEECNSFEQYYFRFSSVLEVIRKLELEPKIIYCDNLAHLFNEPSIESRITDSTEPKATPTPS